MSDHPEAIPRTPGLPCLGMIDFRDGRVWIEAPAPEWLDRLRDRIRRIDDDEPTEQIRIIVPGTPAPDHALT